MSANSAAPSINFLVMYRLLKFVALFATRFPWNFGGGPPPPPSRQRKRRGAVPA
jgi:hypothetical protein